MKEEIRKVGLLNHIGAGNLGDDATVAAVMQAIAVRWPRAEFCAFTMNPADSSARHGIPCFPLRRKTWDISVAPVAAPSAAKSPRRRTLTRVKAMLPFLQPVYKWTVQLPLGILRELAFLRSSYRRLRPLEVLVVAGGGQLTERDGAWAFPYTLWKWTRLAKLAGCRVVFLNLGAGPLAGSLARRFTRHTLRLADYVSFRDQESQQLARATGFSGTSFVFPDNACATDGALLRPRPAAAAPRPLVGFAPVPYGDPGLHPAIKHRDIYDRFLNKCADITSWLAGRQNSVLLFGTDVGVDALANEDLLALIRSRGDQPLPRYTHVQNVPEALDTISAMDYVITCRFHGVVFAHLLNKPVLAIAHHPKVTDRMNALGLGRFCVDIRDFEPEQVMERFEILLRERESVQRILAEHLAHDRRELATQFDGLFPRPPSAPAWSDTATDPAEWAVAGR